MPADTPLHQFIKAATAAIGAQPAEIVIGRGITLYYPPTAAPTLDGATARLAEITTAAVYITNYGNEYQVIIIEPHDSDDEGNDDGQPSPSFLPQPIAQTQPEPPRRANARAEPIDVLRPWWRIHRTEPGCITAAIRYVYGPDAPAGGSFYVAAKRMIERLEAENASTTSTTTERTAT